MNIPEKHLNKYKEISDQEALNELTALVGYMSAIEKYQNNIEDGKLPILCKENHHSVLITKD